MEEWEIKLTKLGICDESQGDLASETRLDLF